MGMIYAIDFYIGLLKYNHVNKENVNYILIQNISWI